MKNYKIIATVLSLLLLCTALGFSTLAAEKEEVVEEEVIDYKTIKYASAEDKLKTMTMYYESGDYEIWGFEETGEVALRVKSTGQIVLSNPYTVASDIASDDLKGKLMSQIILKYSDGGIDYIFDSYTQAALNKQISFKNIRGGVRVEYTMGRQEVRKLVPRMIEKSRLETEIFDKIEDKNSRAFKKLQAYYLLKDASDPKMSEKAKNALTTVLPITKKYAVYMLDPGIVERELYELEEIIKGTGYTFEMMAEDHALVEFTGAEKAPALFKMAIEYYIDDSGIKIRMPASGIRYDASSYKLSNIQLLPYLAAGSKENTGYTMITDGSGTIVRFEDVKDQSLTLTSKLYGQDYSFHKISGSNQEIMRLPVYGMIEDKKEGSEGFVAYLEEGDSMSEVTTDHGGKLHGFNSVYPTFYPRPNDTYALTGISATGSATWTVESERKYTGNYTIRLFPLSGEKASYVGMAETIREYLISQGTLKPLENDKKDSIPLYIENFGAIKTLQKGFLGIPSKVQTPLTTFEQTQEMLEELKDEGIENVNVKLTGWFNGGLLSKVPYNLKIQKSLGGKKGFEKLVSYAKENNVGIYPEMEFTYVDTVGKFDGFNYKNDAIKSIDDRSAQHRVYSALYQGFEKDGSLVLSPKAMTEFYQKVQKKYLKYEVDGLAVSSLGSDLSSDHNEDYPLNREESKEMIADLLSQMKNDNKNIMVSGGNAYVLPYADHILNLPLDSSKNISASEAIPFVAMVLHGYKEYTGTAINLEGDYSYTMLKAIENGANPYFILSIESKNASALKSYEKFSKYYSIRYDIWKEDLISTYNTLNNALKDVRYSTISGHEYIDTRLVRVQYSNGTEFILNYNVDDVTVDGEVVKAMSFVKKG